MAERGRSACRTSRGSSHAAPSGRLFRERDVISSAKAIVWAVSVVPVAAASTQPSDVAPLVIVEKGQAKSVVCCGDGSAAPERNICKVLRDRIRKRTTGALAVVSEAEVTHMAKGLVILVGSPRGNALSRRLCKQTGNLVPTRDNVGPGGFVVHTIDHDGKTWIVLAGADIRGTVCAVGKFLRSIDFRDNRATIQPLSIVDRIDPAEAMDSQQYKPAQWGNSFKDAPIEQIREYLEDLALWGSCSMWNVCCYKIPDPFKKGGDRLGQMKWARVRDLFKYAHSIGLDIGYVDCPNSVYDDQLHLRKLGGKFRYREDVCPSIPEVRKVVLENRENLYRAAKEAGIDLKFALHFAHDNGGCDCERCAPWIQTYLELSEEIYRIAAKHHPHLRIYLTTWMCSGAEKRMMLDYVRKERPKWVAGVMDRPGVELPEGYVSSGWQTIFGCGPRECYGKMGADPLPRFIPGKIQEYHRRGIRALFTYTEGIYDDINSAIAAQACRHPFREDLRDLLEEYCHWNFGTSAADSAKLSDIILTKFNAEKHGSFNARLHVDDPEQVLGEMAEIEKRMPEWGRTGWQYGILKTRVQLERLDDQALSVRTWTRGIRDAFASASGREDAALRQVRAMLVERQTQFDSLTEQCQALTRHLYVDLYGSPNRHPAHGAFRLQLPWRGLVAALAKRCDDLARMTDQAARREGVSVVLAALEAQSPSAGSSPVLRLTGTAVIPGARFSGGAGLRLRPDEMLAHAANLIDAADSGHSIMSAELDFEPGEEPLTQPVKLTLRGRDGTTAGGKVYIEIAVNGKKIHFGENDFGRKRYTEHRYAIRPDHIKPGTNRLAIRNLDPGRSGRQVLIASATLEVSREGEVEMPEPITDVRPPAWTIRVQANLALGRKATASSVYDHRFPASSAIDGKPIVIRGPSENAWGCERHKARGAWWQVDLGKPTPIREVRLWFRHIWSRGYSFVPKSITFQVSNDGAAWQPALARSTDVPRGGTPYEAAPSVFRMSANGRYLRLLFEDGSQNAAIPVMEITEVEVY